MGKKAQTQLSRRERQIMEIVYRRGRATVAEVIEDLADPPSYSSVRALMGILEQKGHLKHSKDGRRYVYRPTRSRKCAGRSAIRQAVHTFFHGSVEQAVAAMLDLSASDLSDEELDRLAERIKQAREKGE